MSRVKSPARCGTTSGFRRHQLDGEKPCPACASAKAAYDKRWRSTPERTRLSRLSAKAQQIALQRLKNENLARYRKYYAEAKATLLSKQESA